MQSRLIEEYTQIMSEQDENCFKKEDRDELKKQGWQLESIMESMKDVKISFNAARGDIEMRVRSLENFKYLAWGMGTVIGILAGYVVQLIAARK